MSQIFRFPGGKSKMLPILMPYLDKILIGQNNFCDAFVGGGSVLCAVAEKYPNISLFCNDKDYGIYSFWDIISKNNTTEMIRLLDLMATPPTVGLFYKLRASSPTDRLSAAYRAIYLNRCAFSGIQSAGPIGGEKQESKYTVGCRYNYKKLKEKILACHELLVGRIVVTNSDINNYDILLNTDYPVYLDPPYIIQGQSLYPIYMKNEEHIRLAGLLNNKRNFILSYDDTLFIRQLYINCNIIDFVVKNPINGKKINWKSNNEIIIMPKL